MVNSSAAPPTLTHLYPAGAQKQPATTEVAVTGTLDGSTQVWTSAYSWSARPSKDKGKIAVDTAGAMPGTYWLRTYNAEGASPLRPFIVGTLPEVTEKEPNDDFKKPHALDGSKFTVNGKLEKNGDVDCFAVNLKKGETLVASLAAHNTLRSPMDGMLQILSADGFVLEENNDFHGLDPQIAFTAKKDGTYIARVYAFPATPDSSIRYFGSDACIYRLTLTTGAFADYTVPLALPQLGPWRVQVEGWNLTPESHKLSFAFGVHDPRYGLAFGTDLANPLRVRSEPHPVYFPKNSGPPTPPYSETARVEKKGDEALFTIDCKKGKALTLQVESRTLGLALNPVVRVLDPDKKQLARAEPGKLNGDTTLSFTPPADERYTVAVSDLFGGGGPRHAFLLRVLSEPDYELSVAADRFTVAVGTPLTIPVKITRLRGFDKPVELAIEGSGAPPGVKIEVVKPAKPDPNTITLSLTATEPASGAFRLVGKVSGDPALKRTAYAPLAEFDTVTPDLWLTVTAPAKK